LFYYIYKSKLDGNYKIEKRYDIRKALGIESKNLEEAKKEQKKTLKYLSEDIVNIFIGFQFKGGE